MLPYIGGKSRLSKWIIENFPEDYRKMTYVEVFGGGGWVLYKKEPSVVEIYNDLNETLVTLFKVIRDNFEVFHHQAQWTLHSRQIFEEALRKIREDKFDCDVEKALAKAIAQVQSFAGEGTSWGYNIHSRDKKTVSVKWMPFIRKLRLINARLKNVQIENLDFERLIRKYDRETTLFYIDPPYVSTEYYYNHDKTLFTKDDHIRLANLLKEIRGKFILSYYKHPLILELYKDYKILFRSTRKSSAGTTKDTKKPFPEATEMLILNY